MLPIQDDPIRKQYIDELTQQALKLQLNKMMNEEFFPVEHKRNTKALKYLEKITGMKANVWYDICHKLAHQQAVEWLGSLSYRVVTSELERAYRVFGTDAKGIQYMLGRFNRTGQATDHVERLKTGKF